MWQSIGTFYLTKDWQYSNPVQGEIFRVRSSYIDNFNNQYLKGVVASIFVDGDSAINLVESRRLSYRLEPDIFTFYFPIGLGEQRIGVKRLDTTNLDWFAEIEVFRSNQNQDNFVNYIISRFKELMPLYSVSEPVETIDAGTFVMPITATLQEIAAENKNRKGLIIYNPSSISIISIGFFFNDDETGLQSIVTVLSPGKAFELPVFGKACYPGKIYAIANIADTTETLQITEFS